MVIVSDTSPIINLAAIGQLELIPKIFGRVYIPFAVYEEIVIRGTGQPGAEEVKHAEWVEVKKCNDRDLVSELLKELDPGESEAIALAIELETPNLLIDEKNGREVATRYHLKPIGILGILLEGKKLGIIHSVKQCMDDLRSTSGFFISNTLYLKIISLADE